MEKGDRENERLRRVEWLECWKGGGGDGIHVTQAKVVAVRVLPSSSSVVEKERERERERDGPPSLPPLRQTESPLSCNSNTT